MKFMKIKAIAVISAVLCFCSGCSGTLTRLTRISDGIHAAEPKHDIAEINKLAAQIPDEKLDDKHIAGYSDKELELLYDSLRKAAFYSPDSEYYVLRQEKTFNEKLRRGRPANNDIRKMISSFLAANMFEKAGNLKKKYPEIDELPDVPDKIILNDVPPDTLWQVYAVSDGGKTIELKTLPLSAGPRIVVIIFPSCGSMKHAMTKILADPELAPVFRAHATLVTRRSNFSGVEEVRTTFDFPEVYIARKSADFPGMYMESSPYFYFLMDGKIAYSVHGWTTDPVDTYSIKQVHNGLAAIGLEKKDEAK